jgi:hypothetical protein
LNKYENFYKEVGKKGKCKLCGAEVPRTQGSTTGMWRHLDSNEHILLVKANLDTVYLAPEVKEKKDESDEEEKREEKKTS